MQPNRGWLPLVDKGVCACLLRRGGSKPRNQLVIQYYTPYAFAIPFRWWQALPYGRSPVASNLSAIDKLVFGQRSSAL